MKTKVLILSLSLILVLTASACGQVTPLTSRLEGSGNLVSEDRSVSGFERVTLSGFGDVTIRQGQTESLTVTTDDNILPYIETEVRGSTLELGFTKAGQRKSFNPSDGIHFDLVVVDLSKVVVSGAGSLDMDKLESERFEVVLSGAGSLTINDLQAEELVATVSGAGSVLVSGEVTGQEVTHSGVGSYHAEDLRSETAIIKISGAGNATIWATETLDVKVSGLGNIIYYGSPRVIQNVSGFGKLISQGEK